MVSTFRTPGINPYEEAIPGGGGGKDRGMMMDMAMGLLQAGGPSTTPISTGQAISQAYMGAQQRGTERMRNQLARDQMLQMKRRQKALSDPDVLAGMGIDENMARILGPDKIADIYAQSLAGPKQTSDITNFKFMQENPEFGKYMAAMNYDPTDAMMANVQVELQRQRAFDQAGENAAQYRRLVNAVRGNIKDIQRMQELGQYLDRKGVGLGSPFGNLSDIAIGGVGYLQGLLGDSTSKSEAQKIYDAITEFDNLESRVVMNLDTIASQRGTSTKAALDLRKAGKASRELSYGALSAALGSSMEETLSGLDDANALAMMVQGTNTPFARTTHTLDYDRGKLADWASNARGDRADLTGQGTAMEVLPDEVRKDIGKIIGKEDPVQTLLRTQKGPKRNPYKTMPREKLLNIDTSKLTAKQREQLDEALKELGF